MKSSEQMGQEQKLCLPSSMAIAVPSTLVSTFSAGGSFLSIPLSRKHNLRSIAPEKSGNKKQKIIASILRPTRKVKGASIR